MNSTTTMLRVFAATLVLIAACGTPGAVRLTDSDDKRSISLKPGETFEIALSANHSTGYQWMLADSTARVVEQFQPARYEIESSGDGRVGMGGIEHWSFRAKAAGKQALRLVYRRPWEAAEASDQVYTVNVTVE